MVKKLSVSISDWVYEAYLSKIENKSRFIEEMVIKGSQITTGEYNSAQQRLLNIAKDLRDKEEEINKLKLLVGSLKKKLSKKKPMSDTEKVAQSVLNRGLY